MHSRLSPLRRLLRASTLSIAPLMPVMALADDGGDLVLRRPAHANASAAFQFKGAEVLYDVDPVLCNGVDIGHLQFRYQHYCDRSGTRGVGGAALAGGFHANGTDPCPHGQVPGTEYLWVQTVTTTHPLRGIATHYTDSRALPDPVYPFTTAATKDSHRDAFTGRTFYDGPSRREFAGEDVYWEAELMLCCRVPGARRIDVIGSFYWGYEIDADGNAHDANVGVQAAPPCCWGPPTDAAVRTVARESRGTPAAPGWTFGRGCCCAAPAPVGDATSEAAGLTDLELGVPADAALEQIVVFPRNREALDALDAPPGFTFEPWPGGTTAPVLPYEAESQEMFRPGLLLAPAAPVEGPALLPFTLLLTGHESWLDVFIHDGDEWRSYVVQTQQLLGDMNGDGLFDGGDLASWDLAATNPAAYAAQFPALDPLYAGDMDHDDALDPDDRVLLEVLLTGNVSDAENAEEALRINEVRLEGPALPEGEYFELAGDPGTPLDGVTYVVLGDPGIGGPDGGDDGAGNSGDSGVIEAAVDLGGHAIGPGGLFLVSESQVGPGVIPDLITPLNFEDGDNVTHLLVRGFHGLVGMDLDLDDDGDFENFPWVGTVDRLALIREENPPADTEHHYGPPAVGPLGDPDSGIVPAHAWRCELPRGWQASPDPGGLENDTPGASNVCADACPADTNADGVVDVEDMVTVVLQWGLDGLGLGGDVNGDGVVDIEDLIAVILGWGPCQAV